MRTKYWMALITIVLLTCQQKKPPFKRYRNGVPIESTILTLYPEGAFELEIYADYFTRISRGRYQILADTLLLNPAEKQLNLIDSVVGLQDPSIRGKKIIQLYKRDFVYGFGKIQSDAMHLSSRPSECLYVNNDTTPVEFDLTTPGIAFVADSIEVTQVRYCNLNAMNCTGEQEFDRSLNNSKANLIKVYLNDNKSEEHYLQHWKWLIKGDTIFNYYLEGCKPNRRIFLQLER